MCEFISLPAVLHVDLLASCRRSDLQTPAGLQQQPVLLWTFHPGATRDGETGVHHHVHGCFFTCQDTCRFLTQKRRLCVCTQEPLEQKYPNLSHQTLSLMKVRNERRRMRVLFENWNKRAAFSVTLPLWRRRAASGWTRLSG